MANSVYDFINLLYCEWWCTARRPQYERCTFAHHLHRLGGRLNLNLAILKFNHDINAWLQAGEFPHTLGNHHSPPTVYGCLHTIDRTIEMAEILGLPPLT